MNIILINCDDLGYGDLGCYGSERNDTPHIDALAVGGLKLESFYMASPVCSASRAAMLTGCYPPRIGFGPTPVLFPGQAEGLNPSETTIAKLFQSNGYATKIIGKWHCGDQPEFLPTNHGFDEYFGIPYSNDMGRQAERQQMPPLPLLRNDTVIQQQPDQRSITERYTDEALQFILRNKDRSFFLYLAHMYVHVPLFVPKQFLDRSRNGAYGAAVASIDWSTGVIVDLLKKLGIFGSTLVIFTSDNGSRNRDEGGSNTPCRGTKASTWEGGQRVPCIFHWPEKIRPGTNSRKVVRSIDFLPTLSTLAGIHYAPNRPIDGIDVSEHLLGKSSDSGNDVFFYYFGSTLCAVRRGDWKLHLHRKGEGPLSELYNLKNDIGETRDLAIQHPEIVEELKVLAEDIRARLGDDATGIQGTETRPVGKSRNPKPLTEYNPAHPYMVACYDLPDMPTMVG